MDLNRISKRTALWLAMVVAFSGANFGADIDTDGDGMIDAEEATFGTNPNDAQSVPLRSLASWRFTNGSYVGDQGQQPIAQSNVSIDSEAFEGAGVNFLPNAAAVSLKYRAVETSGRPNISPIRGSILFRFQANWSSDDGPRDDGGWTAGDGGPGSWVTVLQTTNFAALINPRGNRMFLVSRNAGVTVTNAYVDIDVYPGFPESEPGKSAWSYGLVTYSPEASSLGWDVPNKPSFINTGIIPPANLNGPNNFLSIGSAADGTGEINGAIDEVVTFNGRGIISTTPTQMSVVTSENPPGINLVWTTATNALLEVRRRVVGASTWETTRGSIGTSFFDGTVVRGERYEYHINSRVFNVSNGLVDKFGLYVKGTLAGAPLHNRGKLILLVDSTLTNAIAPELSQFVTNLVGDGWQVLRLNTPRHVDDYSTTTSFLTNHYNIVNVIKPFITSNYTQFGPEIKHILILGHVPVPHTGFRADDGHSKLSDVELDGIHSGAWPSDLYYGDINGTWTDVQNSPWFSPTLPHNKNVPGDGKFDQEFGTTVEIGVSRIDLSNMPDFAPRTEADLMKKYLTKNAGYRAGQITFAEEATWVEDSFFGSTLTVQIATELLSKVSPLKATQAGDIFVTNTKFLFGVASGAGTYDSINDARPNMHDTGDIAAGITGTNCAFYYLRGSYFADWNSTNNFLRAVLGTTNGGLTAAPYLFNKTWRGDGLGVGLMIAQEQPDIVNAWPTVLDTIQSPRTVEIMGDGTLRYPIIDPPGSVSWTTTNNAVTLSWAAAPGSSGYFVYRSSNGILGEFQQISATPVTGTTYTDNGVPAGAMTYMVRGFSLATTGGGTFTNLSQGVFSVPISGADPAICCIEDVTIPEDGGSEEIDFTSGNALVNGTITVTATSSNTQLVPNGNLVLSGSGNTRHLSVAPSANESGSSLITIKMQDSLNSVVKRFSLNVLSVNDAPSFTAGGNRTVEQGSGLSSFSGWASAINRGAPNESGQQVSFVVTNDSPHLFTGQPSVTSAGTLLFVADSSRRGTASVSVQVKDNGGTANGGIDVSYPQIFQITIGQEDDSDGDGLPDDFEEVFGFNPNVGGDGAVDWDGDGITSALEMAAGTHPKESSSAFRIGSAGSHSPTFGVAFNSVSGNDYTVDYDDSFPAGSWQTLETPIPGTGAPIETLDTDAGNSSRRIYRVTTTGLGGEALVTEYAGLCRLNLLGNSDTMVSIPFFRPAVEFASIIGMDGNTVILRGASTWQQNQWVYSGAQSNTYFMLVRSGLSEGEAYTIIGNTGSTLTVDAEGGFLNVSFGDSIAIVPYWTLGTLFPGGEGVHASSSPANRATEILFQDLAQEGINLSALSTCYFWNGAWRKSGSGATICNDDVIGPDMYVTIRHNVATGTTLTTEGAVLAGRFQTLIRRNGATKQDNIVAMARPVAVSLDFSGLIESGAFRASPQPTARLDELLVFNNSVAGKNKTAGETYYYWNGAWRKVGLGSENRGNDAVFQPGTGVIIRSGVGGGEAVWSHEATYQ